MNSKQPKPNNAVVGALLLVRAFQVSRPAKKDTSRGYPPISGAVTSIHHMKEMET